MQMRWLRDNETGKVLQDFEWKAIAPDRPLSALEEVCMMDGHWYNLNKDLIPFMDPDLAAELQDALGNASDQKFLDWYRSQHRQRFGKEFRMLTNA